MEKQIQKIRQKIKFNRGSILAVSLIILGLMLISALSSALVSIQERKASMGENTSNQAYSTAETGVEKVMQAIKDNATLTVDKLAAAISGVTCTGGALVGTDGFKVQLKDANDAVIDCSTTADVALVRSVKSIGTAGQNQRAVEVAVAGSGDYTLSCIGSGAASSSTCFRIDTSTGAVECKILVPFNEVWQWFPCDNILAPNIGDITHPW